MLVACNTDQDAPPTRSEYSALTAELRKTEADLKVLEATVQSVRAAVERIEPRLPAESDENRAIEPRDWKPDGSHLDDPFFGPKEAPVVLMEFGEYYSAACRQFLDTTLPLIRQNFAEKKLVRFIFRDFPLPHHSNAPQAAAVASCAGEQGKYWDIHPLLFAQPETKDVSDVVRKVSGLDEKKLRKCVKSGRYHKEIDADLAEGQRLGVKGTPGFFLGKEGKDGLFHGVFIRGAQPYPVFAEQIEKLLQ